MIRLRPAVPGDVAMLKRWDAQPHVMAAGGSDDVTDWDAEVGGGDPFLEVLISEVDGRAVGVVQIIDPALESSHYWGQIAHNLRAIDIWIGEAGDLGRGYGTAMMGLALDRCFAGTDVTAVLIDPLTSNTRAHRFYQRLGFVPVEVCVFGDDECLVHRIERARWAAASQSIPRTAPGAIAGIGFNEPPPDRRTCNAEKEASDGR